jgi:phage-related protein
MLPWRRLGARAIKAVEFRANALDDLKAFPTSARRQAGYQIQRVQSGDTPSDWKPMLAIGAGVQEIRIRDDGDAFRVIYVAKFQEAVFVLYCFQKKTRKTSQQDIDVAATRYKALVKELKDGR